MKRLIVLMILFSLTMVDSIKANGISDPIDENIHFELVQYDWPMTLRAWTDIRVDVLRVWNILTDYDHLADFLPQMRVSRVVRRTGEKIVIEQVAMTHFLFFSKKIEVKLNILEEPYQEIAFYKVDGNMEFFSGKWILNPIENGQATRLIYMLKFKPAFYTPKWVARHALDHEIPEQIQLIANRAKK